LPTKRKRIIERYSSVHTSQARSPFWLLKPSMNMRMRVCYLDRHEAGLCCYLVIHIENLLRPLQLFYFHLWPIYWLYLLTLPRMQTYMSLTFPTCTFMQIQIWLEGTYYIFRFEIISK
jgi:hypothetical protein